MGKKQRKEKSLVAEILLGVGEDIARLADRVPYRGIPYEQVVAIERGRERRRRIEAIKRLERQKILATTIADGTILISLTNTGRLRLLRERIRETRERLPDGKQCVVFFDIPVGANRARRAFLHFLKSVGFSRRQLSVYSTTRDVFEMLAEFVSRSKISKWVVVAQTELAT